MSALLSRMQQAVTLRHDQARTRYPKLIAAIAGGDDSAESETELAALIDTLGIDLAAARCHISAVQDVNRHESSMVSADKLAALSEASTAAANKLWKAQSEWLAREKKLNDELQQHSGELALAERRNERVTNKIVELKRDNPLAFDPPVTDSPVVEIGDSDESAAALAV